MGRSRLVVPTWSTSLTLDELRRPHASIPRNPLVAEPMFLARYAEKAGSSRQKYRLTAKGAKKGTKRT